MAGRRITKLPRMSQIADFRWVLPDAFSSADGRTLRIDFEVVKRTEVRWLVCIAISIALHLAVLLRAPIAAIWPAGMAARGPVIDVRLAPSRPPVEAATAESKVEPQVVVPVPTKTPEPQRTTAPRSESIGTPAAVPVPLEFDDAQYAASGTLSVRPTPMGEISVPYPKDTSDRGISKTSLTLFIDEHGAVVRVRVDDSELPPQFGEAAKNAFAKARFHPGQVGDYPVKSRMRVEVIFESNPTPR